MIPLLFTFMIILFLLLIMILFVGGTVAIFFSMYRAQKSAAPFFPSPKKIMRRAMAEMALKKGEIFYDLGAGTGTSLIVADKGFGAIATGSEINLLPYLIAKVKIFFSRSQAKMKFENLFTQNISDADVVFCFLTEKTMAKLEPKFLKELKPGTRIACYTFPLPTLKPEQVIPIHGNWKIFLYRIA
jgi:hypothetical protein